MRIITAVLSFGIPLLIVWLAGRLIVPPEFPKTIQVQVSTVKDAVESLSSASQWLGTITVSAIAAGGAIVYKERKSHPWVCRTIGTIGFCAGVVSMLFACALTYWAVISVSNNAMDIRPLTDLFAKQAMFALVLACSLCALLASGSADA